MAELPARPVELHLFSPVECDGHIELLTALAHYHRTGEPVGLGHTVNFGRPWLPGSACNHGLISLPYLDGRSLEEFRLAGVGSIHFLWLIPITQSEREYKMTFGLEALEEKFDAAKLDYLNPCRPSVI
ncbi:MAG TPA: suppressor of fused domain protein [Tepidisphaeraceae bacterium]|nr:suppressor of fused domain protein [Tepidisphaeraceae bacterium]